MDMLYLALHHYHMVAHIHKSSFSPISMMLCILSRMISSKNPFLEEPSLGPKYLGVLSFVFKGVRRALRH